MEKPRVLLIDIDSTSAELVSRISRHLGYEMLICRKMGSANGESIKGNSEVAVFQLVLADAISGKDCQRISASQSISEWIFIPLRHPLFGELFAEMERARNVLVKKILIRPLTAGQIREALSKDGLGLGIQAVSRVSRRLLKLDLIEMSKPTVVELRGRAESAAGVGVARECHRSGVT